MKLYTIYRALCKTTNKSYIGFDSNYPARQVVHKCSSKKEKTKFYNAIRKYGWDDFEWSILYQSTDRDNTLHKMEKHFIELYDSFINGYNSTLGGDGTFGYVFSEEQRKNISEKNKISKPQTVEHVAARIASLKNNPNAFKGFLGKTHSEETRKRLSDRFKGESKSKEHIEAMKHRPQDITIIECEYCGKIGPYKNMKQWHGDRCKLNPNQKRDLEKIVTCSVCGYTTKRSVNFYRYHEKSCKLSHQVQSAE
jgi:group I intron endonuclease